VRVLLVASRSRFATALTNALRSKGHEVDQPPADVDHLAVSPCDIVLVELDQFEGSGVRLCRELRSRTDTALIGLTTRGREDCGIAALEQGADDYVTKPVSLTDLLARMGAVLRRCRHHPYGELTVGRLRLDLDRQRAAVDGHLIPLTRKEFRLLVALARRPDAVVTRDRLMAEVWNTNKRGSRTVDSHINTLRPKIRSAATVDNVRGVGYRLSAPAIDDAGRR
jgi:DNA-binding response OmpR family regulator